MAFRALQLKGQCCCSTKKIRGRCGLVNHMAFLVERVEKHGEMGGRKGVEVKQIGKEGEGEGEGESHDYQPNDSLQHLKASAPPPPPCGHRGATGQC